MTQKSFRRSPTIYLDTVASISANTLNFTDLGSPYEGPPSTPHSGIMDTPDVAHTPKYMDGSTISSAPPNKSAFVELQQHGLVCKMCYVFGVNVWFWLRHRDSDTYIKCWSRNWKWIKIDLISSTSQPLAIRKLVWSARCLLRKSFSKPTSKQAEIQTVYVHFFSKWSLQWN